MGDTRGAVERCRPFILTPMFLATRRRHIEAWHGWLPMYTDQRTVGWRESRAWIAELWRRRTAVLWDEGIASDVHLRMLWGQGLIVTPTRRWRYVPDASIRCNLSDCKHRAKDEIMPYRDKATGDVIWLCLCGTTGMRFGHTVFCDVIVV